jgi:predicted PurR-regulated permease PerM
MLRSGRWGDGEIASFGGTVLTLAAIAVVLGALHFASAFVTPVLLALVLALIFWPVYVWLRGRGLAPWLALLALLVGLVVGFVLLVAPVSYSMSSMLTRLTTYSEHLSANLQLLDASVSPQTLASLFAWLVGTLAGALRQGFIILLLLLVFVAEGPFVMARLRASLREDDPNIARLSVYRRDVSQYFILRAAANAVTGAGVALVLWLVGVDFPLLWGVLTFFLSFIPYIGMFVASVPSVLLA